MKPKVIIFCVLIFCSFVVSIPFGEESIQKRALPPPNWQDNNKHYHSHGFAQTQNVNTRDISSRHDHSHEHINQERQSFDNFGFNKNPALHQPLPLKDRQVNFAPESTERRLDGYPARRDASFPKKNENNPIRIDNQQYRTNNWPSQNRFANAASSASAVAISGSERPLPPVREPYRAPGLQTHYPAINQVASHQHNPAERINPTVRETHFHPVAERPINVRYVHLPGSDSDSTNRHVHYENYNEAHSATTNAKGVQPQQSGHNDFVENSSSFTAPAISLPHGGYNSVIADTIKNNNYPIQHGPRNPNFPNIYRSGPSNVEINNGNTRHIRKPETNAVPVNQMPPRTYENPIVPTNTVFDKTGNTRYVDNRPKVPQPINNYKYRAPHYFNAPMPTDMEFNQRNRFGVKPTIVSSSNYQSPGNTFNEAVPAQIDSVVPSSAENPPRSLAPDTIAYDVLPLTPLDLLKNKDRKPVEPEPALETSKPLPPENVNSYKNIYSQLSGSDRVNTQKLLDNPKLKELVRPKSRYLVIYQDGTVEHIEDMEQIKANKPNYIVVKKTNQPVDELPVYGPASYDKQPIQNYTDTSSNKTDYSLPLLPPLPGDNDFNQPSGSRQPMNDTSQEGLQTPTTDAKDSIQISKSSYGDVYSPSSVLEDSSGNNYNSSSDKLYADSNKNETQATNTKAPDDKLLQSYLSLFPNKTDNSTPSDNLYFIPSGRENNTLKESNTSQDDLNDFLSSLSGKPSKKSSSVPIPLDSTDDKNASSSSQDNRSSESLPYKTSQNNESTTLSPKLDTVISPGLYRSTTPSDNLINSTDNPNKPNGGDTIKSNDTDRKPIPKTNDTTPVIFDFDSLLSEPSKSVGNSTVRNTTEDPIITISPIELDTSNVKNGSSVSDTVTPTYDKEVSKANSTPTTNDTDTPNKVVIKVINDDDNDTIAKVLSSPKIKNVTGSGDNSTTGDDLLESDTSDITITLSVPNDSDGTLTIKVEGADSTGSEETSGDETLVLNIDTKNCSDTDISTASKLTSTSKGTNRNQTPIDGLDKSKNIVIDLPAILLSNSTDKDFIDQITNNVPIFLLYVIQMQPQPIIEKDKVTTVYCNNTVVEKLTETTWQNKNDTAPSVVTVTKIYQQDPKN